MARHTLSHAVNLFSGEAQKNGFLGSLRGLPIDLLILDDLGTPAVADVNGYVVSENLAAAGNYALDGALVTGGVGVADVSRGVQIVSDGADTDVLTFTGTDKFGTALTEDLTLNGTNIVFGKKAFKKITQIASDGANSNNVTIGTSDLIGLTYRVENPEDVIAIYEDGAAGRTARAAAAAAPAAVTAVATQAQGSASTVAAASTAVTITNAINTLTAVNGDGMTSGQEGEVDTLFAEVKTDLDAIKVEVDRLVVESDDEKVQTDKLVIESADYKVQIDKLVLDLAAQKVELDKLILDVDLGTVGSFIKADKTAATATTGDVRGTYDPSTVLDGVKTIKVLLRPQSRTSIGAYGVAQA